MLHLVGYYTQGHHDLLVYVLIETTCYVLIP